MDEDSIYNILTAHGIDADMVDIEFTSMQNNNEVALYAATAQAAKLNTADEVQSTNATYTVVYVDAFRVYQPISDESKYDAVEQGEKYASVYDYVKNGAELDKDLTDSAVYVEYSGNQEITRITELDDYKHGGPQNEVYLTSSTSMKNYVGMILYGWNGSSHLMVSAKAISGKPTLATETGEQHCALAIQSSTEMYYDITKYVEYDNELGQYILILGNGSSATSVLSVAAFKVSSDVTVKASSTLAQRMTAYITTNSVETTFAPKVFRPTEQTNAFVNDVITIPVQATVDVCEFVVYSDSSLENAVPYISEPYWNNKRAFNKGKTDVKSYLAYIQAPEKPGEYTYYMAAFDADGNRSAPVKVVVTVTE